MAKLFQRNPDGRMPLKAHLVELRNRLVICGIALLLGTIVGWFLYEPVLEQLSEPFYKLRDVREGDLSINYSTVASPFDFKVKVSMFIGVFLCSPVWLYELWAFIVPGLKRHEKMYAGAFVIAAVPLFLSGAAFGYWTIDAAVGFLVLFTPAEGSNYINAQDYLRFVMQLVLAFGACFLVPLFLVAMNLIGLISARSMLKGWRWMVVLSFTFAAIVTPTADIVTMFILAVPLLLLFALAVGISWLFDRRKAAKNAALLAEYDESEASP